ncbi:phage regulatory protein, rha family [Arboricoccus pini]|uniref:Phage regulatory protein, rha family n=2 Tax=Arboricoccus pini TaxID=1963835 RepID=A0A212R719_9PROT|nr:phage regulatory protein, rha family [Arboricoccus pini]
MITASIEVPKSARGAEKAAARQRGAVTAHAFKQWFHKTLIPEVERRMAPTEKVRFGFIDEAKPEEKAPAAPVNDRLAHLVGGTELVTARDGKVFTTSLQVAKVFGKRHDNILSLIDSISYQAGSTALDFKFSSYTDVTGRKLRMFEMGRDGFTLLAMGFTGAKDPIEQAGAVCSILSRPPHRASRRPHRTSAQN